MEKHPKKHKGPKQGKGHNIKLSKAMSYILRHGAIEHGIDINDDGYVKLTDLMAAESVARSKPKLKDILDCVNNNDKKRFQMKVEPEGAEPVLENLYIRAAQGHTLQGIEEEKLLNKIEFPYKYPTIVHGTYKNVLEPIMEKGLCKMQRNHIHFAKGYSKEQGVISGMRSSVEIYIEVNLGKIIHDGIPIYESSNGVILTPGIDGYLPPKYFRTVKSKKETLHMADFDYIVVFDFEAAFGDEKGDEADVHEIIEFPAAIIDCNTLKVVKAFRTYVKPTLYPVISEKCTELTGITQNDVDSGVDIQTALLMFHEFLHKNNVLGSEFILMCCGDYDVKAIKREAEHKNFFVPQYMKEWINIKKVFPKHLFNKDFEEVIVKDNIKKQRPVVTGMTDMLEICGLELLGKHHSGLDDSINIARCVTKSMEEGYKFTHAFVGILSYTAPDEQANEFYHSWAEKFKGQPIPEVDVEEYLETLEKLKSE